MYYVIQVKTGYEDRTIEAIDRQLGGKDGFDVFSPYRLINRKYRGVWKEVKERCFPGYVFVETDTPKDLFFDLYWVPEFTKLLGREPLTYNFVPLNPDEARMVDILYSENNDRITTISDIVVKEGQIVRILNGPLQGMKSRIKKVNLHKRSVTVEFMMCGRLVSTEVGINIITDIL